MAKSSKKKKQNVFRLYNSETGEHYTLRLSKSAQEKLTDKAVMKFSAKLKKHTEFKLTKKVK
jgi:ribosomal protein L33